MMRNARAIVWCFLVIAALLSESINGTKFQASKEEKKLMDYIQKKGGYFAYNVGRSCPTCLRGVIATKNLARGDLILAVPLELGIKIPPLTQYGFAGEYAHNLVYNIYSDSYFNKTYGIFLDSQPGIDELLTPELVTEELWKELQIPELQRLIKHQRKAAIDAYNGKTQNEKFKPIPELLGDKAPSLEIYFRYAAIIGSRDFSLSDEGGHSSEMNFSLLPVADMINHADEPNAHRTNNESHVLIYAATDIKVGEEITNNYQPLIIHRNDISFYIYGFVQESNQERMLAVDLPTYDPGNPFSQTKEDDTYFYGPSGLFNKKSEVARLQALLEEMPTTLEDDKKLLESGKIKDWKMETVIKLRMGRKMALKNAIESIIQVLDDPISSQVTFHDEL